MDFRTVSSHLGPMTLSRGPLSLGIITNRADRMATTEEVKLLVDGARNDGDAMVWLETSTAPLDIRNTFAGVSQVSRIMIPQFGVNFLEDLDRYIAGLGFSSFLGHRQDGGLRPLNACNFMTVEKGADQDLPPFLSVNYRADEEASVYREFFGAGYPQLKGRSILLNTQSAWMEMGTFSLCSAIAHELGCVKLVEHAKADGWKREDISQDAELFYTYSYTYSFLYFLSQLMGLKDNGLRVTGGEEAANLEVTFKASYARAMVSFDRMTRAERGRYILVHPRMGMEFGKYLAVNVNTLHVTGTSFPLVDESHPS